MAQCTISRREADQNTTRFLFVASDCSVRLKGLDILLEAIRILRDRNVVNFSLTIVGDQFKQDSDLGALPISHIPKQSRDQMSHIFQDHDFTVVPSRSDNSPNVILESFSVGTPVIGSRRGGIPYLIKSGFNGQLFDPTPRNLAELMLSIIKKEIVFWEDWKIIEEYNANFSKELIYDRHIKIYEKLLNNE